MQIHVHDNQDKPDLTTSLTRYMRLHHNNTDKFLLTILLMVTLPFLNSHSVIIVMVVSDTLSLDEKGIEALKNDGLLVLRLIGGTVARFPDQIDWNMEDPRHASFLGEHALDISFFDRIEIRDLLSWDDRGNVEIHESRGTYSEVSDESNE
ncbi:hypothetical protein Scep_012182 [Stephania cephalantha]|uniref:Uncharacterized protein n=1 Tax=Stephania cephalantha TaxID=152367 RepID=A0AAP0P785_9MAGN